MEPNESLEEAVQEVLGETVPGTGSYDWLVKIVVQSRTSPWSGRTKPSIRVVVKSEPHAKAALFQAMRDPVVSRAVEVDGRDVEIMRV